jgi:Ice-binding-like
MKGRFKMKRKYTGLLTIVGLAAFLFGSSSAFAAVTLGTTVQTFAVLGGSTVTNTGSSVINGNVGVSPGPILQAAAGFPPGLIVGGTFHPNDAVAGLAQNELTTAYNAVAGTPCTVDLTGQDLGGLTLTPGVYCFTSSAQLTGTLTLNLQGNPNAQFLFKIGSTLTTAGASSVLLINTGGTTCPPNLYWQVGSSATLGTTTSFVGNILALTSITLTTGAGVIGRTLARNGAVTLDTNTVNISACAAAVVPPPAGLTCVSALTAGGAPGTETVTLSAPAPVGGTLVTLTSSAPGTASVPLSVLVPAGATSVTFTVTPGATPGNATISATTGGGTVSCTLIVGAAVVTPAAAAGGPTLDSFGLAILLVLLAVAGVLAVNRFAS